jgi:1-acyl-sn-glycerol-3-phosphate acyltransferase
LPLAKLRPEARALARIANFSAHAAAGLCLVLAVFPFTSRRTRDDLKQRWSRSLLAGLGVALRTSGTPPSAPMLVANHVSWLDVVALSALAPAAFVAKHELRRWPAIGTVIALSGTIFIRRDRLRDILRVNERLGSRMRAGARVAVFPEGTTTDGSSVAPFRNALLQPAIDGGHALQPVAISFRDPQGRLAPEAGYHGDTSFGASLLAVARARGVAACVHFAPPIDTRGLCRRKAGALARERILGLLEEPRGKEQPAAAPEHGAPRAPAFGIPSGFRAGEQFADMPEA